VDPHIFADTDPDLGSQNLADPDALGKTNPFSSLVYEKQQKDNKKIYLCRKSRQRGTKGQTDTVC